MAQLLVRDVDESLVRKLKRRAMAHGVSAEEEHRRILKETLSKPLQGRRTLIEYLISPEGEVEPDLELDMTRSREVESRDTGF